MTTTLTRLRARSALTSSYNHAIKSYTTASASQLQSAHKYCIDSVRKGDYDGYLCVPFFPDHLRNTQYALRAFNVELASIRENVSKPEIGKMRMQFWKDTIDKVYAGKAPQQPIALALEEALQRSTLSSMWFKRIITERMANLEDHPFMTIKEMEDYGENTASSLLYLQLESLGVHDVQVDHVVSHLGKMMGISTFLRSLPFHLGQKRLVLPAQVTAKHNISQENVMRGQLDGMEDAVFEVATAAYDQLLTARSLLDTVTPEAFPVILSSIPHVRYLERLEKHNFNVFEPKLQRKDWKLPLVLWSSFRNRKI